jgi:hypothetical protein
MSSFGESIGKRRRGQRTPFGDPASSSPASAAISQVRGAQGPPATGQAAGMTPAGQVPSGMPAAEQAEAAQAAAARSELARRRDALAAQVTELHWDLGGLAYEMAIRDHFRLDVLVRRAATLQERDAELAELERLLALEERAIAGACPDCGAPHSRGAVYCWQCGATLLASVPSSALPALESESSAASTAAIDALLAPDTGTAEHADPRRSPLAAFGEE